MTENYIYATVLGPSMADTSLSLRSKTSSSLQDRLKCRFLSFPGSFPLNFGPFKWPESEQAVSELGNKDVSTLEGLKADAWMQLSVMGDSKTKGTVEFRSSSEVNS